VLILTQDRCTVCAKHTIGLEMVLDSPMELIGDVGHDDSCFGPIGDNVSVGATKVHVCAKCTIGSGMVLVEADGTPR
jgi:hypothetical protein